MNLSVLEKPPVEPDRPYSQKELSFMKQNVLRKLHLGTQMIAHQDCGHFYYAKINGRKEKEAKESNTCDVGNCSVCWKLNRTPRRLRKNAIDLVNDYCHYFATDVNYTYNLVSLEADYYTWLYNEFNPVRKED